MYLSYQSKLPKMSTNGSICQLGGLFYHILISNIDFFLQKVKEDQYRPQIAYLKRLAWNGYSFNFGVLPITDRGVFSLSPSPFTPHLGTPPWTWLFWKTSLKKVRVILLFGRKDGGQGGSIRHPHHCLAMDGMGFTVGMGTGMDDSFWLNLTLRVIIVEKGKWNLDW